MYLLVRSAKVCHVSFVQLTLTRKEKKCIKGHVLTRLFSSSLVYKFTFFRENRMRCSKYFNIGMYIFDIYSN